PLFPAYLPILDAFPVEVLTGERYLLPDLGLAFATRAERGAPAAPVRVDPAARAQAFRETLRSGPGSGLFRRYLELAIECSLVPRAQREANPVDAIAADETAPLLRYRRNVCGAGLEDLRLLRAEDPEFVD